MCRVDPSGGKQKVKSYEPKIMWEERINMLCLTCHRSDVAANQMDAIIFAKKCSLQETNSLKGGVFWRYKTWVWAPQSQTSRFWVKTTPFFLTTILHLKKTCAKQKHRRATENEKKRRAPRNKERNTGGSESVRPSRQDSFSFRVFAAVFFLRRFFAVCTDHH